jgi:hypothetical protein
MARLARTVCEAGELAEAIVLERPAESHLPMLDVIGLHLQIVLDAVEGEAHDVRRLDQRPPRLADLLRPAMSEAA